MSVSYTTLADMPSKLRSLYQTPKPDIKINLDTRKKTYTTLDRIEGNVVITAPTDTDFDAIDIEFVGTARTYVERLTTAAAASGRSEAFHQFLKLQQPGMHFYYPDGQVLKAGVTYRFPFEFAVPQQLLPRVCQHHVHNETVREAHLRLPPTFGDKDLSDRQKVLDDLAPDMASVRYGVFAKITEIKARGDEAWRSVVASKATRVRVIPAIEEHPPMDIQEGDSEFTMRKEKTIRKGVLKSKTGTLVMEAAQPQSLKLNSYSDPEQRQNTVATIMLRFDTINENTPPPKLGNLASKLKITTWFASTARHHFPTKSASLMDMAQGLHTEQINLSSRNMSSVEWVKVDPANPDTITRRDSATSTFSMHSGETPKPSEGYKGKPYHVARLIVPVQLPTNKAFAPTFHSCLISRVYALKLDLNISSSGIGPSVELKLPLQISSEGLLNNDFERRESIDATNDAEIDVDDVSGFFADVFQPRTIRVPSEGFVGRSRIGSQAPIGDSDAPPGYSPVASPNTARMTYHRAMSVSVPVH